MLKYDPLRRWLVNQGQRSVTITFQEMERIIGDRLPMSARRYSSWWENDFNEAPHAKAWRAAGFRADARQSEEIVTFTKQ